MLWSNERAPGLLPLAAERRPSPPVTWNGRVAGGRDEQLGEVTATRQEDGVETAAVLAWSHGGLGEPLRLNVDRDGVAGLSAEEAGRLLWR